MLRIFLNFLFAYGKLDNATADNLFNKETKLSSPAYFNNELYANPVSVNGERDKLAGEIFKELRIVLSHYYAYFHSNAPEFKKWYDSDYLEMDEETKKQITNLLNTNIKSIHDLDSFWLETQGPYLQAVTTKLSDKILKLKDLVDSENYKYNRIKEDSVFGFEPELRNNWLVNKAIYIVENLKAGMKNHEDGRFTEVFKNFLTAVVEKKKIDAGFDRLTLNI